MKKRTHLSCDMF